MKQSTVLSIFLFLVFVLVPTMAQEQSIAKRKVPKAVLEAFRNSYPNAGIKGFSKETDEGKVVYEVESLEGKVHRDVTYLADGTLVSVEETVPVSEFPEGVRGSLTREFPDAKIAISEKLTKGSAIQYEVLLNTHDGAFEVVFDPDGTIVKKEEKKKGED